MKRRNLLIVCAGDSSLHTHWTNEHRTYDIITIYYGTDEKKSTEYKRVSDYFFKAKGFKIELARKILFEQMLLKDKFAFSDYEYVWFPDDDIRFESDHDIEKLFDIVKAIGCDVFQPAIKNEYFSRGWEATRLIENAFAHRVNIIEVMAHGFSGDFFQKCYLTAIHVCEFMRSGWGIEPIWKKIGEGFYGRFLETYVIDEVPIIHTRPIGGGATLVHKLGMFEAGFIPQIETNRMVTFSVFNNLGEINDSSNTLSILSTDYSHYEKSFAEWDARYGIRSKKMLSLFGFELRVEKKR